MKLGPGFLGVPRCRIRDRAALVRLPPRSWRIDVCLAHDIQGLAKLYGDHRSAPKNSTGPMCEHNDITGQIRFPVMFIFRWSTCQFEQVGPLVRVSQCSPRIVSPITLLSPPRPRPKWPFICITSIEAATGHPGQTAGDIAAPICCVDASARADIRR